MKFHILTLRPVGLDSVGSPVDGQMKKAIELLEHVVAVKVGYGQSCSWHRGNIPSKGSGNNLQLR